MDPVVVCMLCVLSFFFVVPPFLPSDVFPIQTSMQKTSDFLQSFIYHFFDRRRRG